MLENRSFDHMLGCLSLAGRRPDIDGLRPGLANEYQGRSYPVHHLDTTALDVDPDHSADAVDKQVAGGSMGGFIANAAATLAGRGIQDGDPACVMGYYDDADVPVYDHLAEEFAICDRWFSSVPGATLPNRVYALCGVAGGSRDDRPPHVPPLYHQPSFVRHIDAHRISWRWYSFDPGTLRLADAHYLLGHHRRFGYFSKNGLPWQTLLDLTVNDDHPPADIRDGQDLVLAVHIALAASPQWDRSLLVIVYDEHGGFYDHVPPPHAADDEPAMFGRYGVRVPAIIVSPWVEPRTVSSKLFDHTSIIKTIMLRFCPKALHEPQQAEKRQPRLGLGPQYPGMRVAHANHLGELLTRTTPRPAPPRDALLQQAAARAAQATTSESRTGHPLNDLQKAPLPRLMS
jgi:phospholipase C